MATKLMILYICHLRDYICHIFVIVIQKKRWKLKSIIATYFSCYFMTYHKFLNLKGINLAHLSSINRYFIENLFECIRHRSIWSLNESLIYYEIRNNIKIFSSINNRIIRREAQGWIIENKLDEEIRFALFV